MSSSVTVTLFLLLACAQWNAAQDPKSFKVTVEEFSFQDTKEVVKSSSNVLYCVKGECNCLSKKETVKETKLCDGRRDCSDGSDESLKCLKTKCPPTSFKCSYGACINATLKCNGVNDCDDQSDETLPECKVVETVEEECNKVTSFRCKCGNCVDRSLTCNGVADCPDDSDESIMQCISKICKPGLFQCAYGGCIAANKRCNGVPDCIDRSDEHDCRPKEVITTPAPPVRSTYHPVPPPRKPRHPHECILPPQPKGGFYMITMGDEEIDPVPGDSVPQMTAVSVNCSENDDFYLNQDSPYAFCKKGMWKPWFPKCQKYCGKLISTTMDIVCTYKGEAVSCENPVPPGTIATAKCKPSFSSGQKINKRQNVCLQNGMWEYLFLSCTPDCGMINHDSVKALISYGIKTKPGQYPWFIGLYQVMDEATHNYEHICGGTLISQGIVLSAAHCVYREETGCLIEESLLKVAAGKICRDWNEKEPYGQKRDVRQIIAPKTYRGSVTSFAQDIVLLDLVADFVLSNVIQPACLDCSGELEFPPDILSTAVGFGRNEKGIPSKHLMVANLPVLTAQDCIPKISSRFGRYITYDKFCAGYKNGTGVQQGDSGGGLTVKDQKSKLEYILGIVSIKPKDEKTYAAFTNVTDHCKWLGRTILAIKQQRKMHLSLLHE